MPASSLVHFDTSHKNKGVNMSYSYFGKKFIFSVFASSLLVGLISGNGLCASDKAVTAGSASSDIIGKFKTPDVDAKPMARMWFTDAGAGASPEGLAMVARQINDMAAGGFGGVEIAYLSDGSSYTNEEAKTIGWGSENWRKIMKQILKTANGVKTGFKVDITITSHWPPAVNNIDPNDDEASQEASYAYKKITGADLAAGRIDLPLPVQKKEDYFSPMGGSGKSNADFLFVDKFVAATVAKVAGFDAQGRPILEFASLKDVTALTKKKTTSDAAKGKTEKGIVYAGYAAGIPDKAYCAANSIDYKSIIEKFGPEPKTSNFTGKIDTDKNRKRMADWQYIYETDLTALKDIMPSSGSDLVAGDYVIFGSYYRGTGQTHSGGGTVTMYNRCYATDYFSDKAVNKIFEYWSKDIADAELLALLKENGGKNGTSIFEDSIEIHKSGAAWTYDLLDEFQKYNGYSAAKYAPLLAMGSTANFDNRSEAQRILEDYNLVMGNLYSTEHAAKISQWAKSFNYTYRAQAYPLQGLDVDAAALAIDVPEGDNSTAGDGVRQLASAVYMKGNKMLSMESTTFSANIFSTWVDVMKELNADFSQGVSRSILHGSAFSRNFNGYQSSWPGWNFFKTGLNGGGFSSWNGRQIYWGDVDTASSYISRLQAIVQNGQAKVDLAVLLDTEAGFGNQGGNSLQALLDKGYSYSVMSEPVLKLNNAVVKNGILAPDGPAYKALIVKNGSTMSATLIEKIVTYAKNGLPVILYNSDIKRVYGTNKTGNNDTILKEKLSALMKIDKVSKAKSEGEILSLLKKYGVNPAASYDQSGLEATHREAKEGIYYYLYNGKGVSLGGMFGGMPGGFGEGRGAAEGANAPEVTSGAPIGGTGYSGASIGGPGMGGMPGATGGAPSAGGVPGAGGQGGMPGGAGGMGGAPGTGAPSGGGFPGAEGAQGGGGAPGMGGAPGGGGPGTASSTAATTDNSISTTVTLEGVGKPYILNAWTGEITPVAQYTERDGKITMNISLKGRESMVVCIAQDTAGFPKAADYAMSASGGKVVIDNGKPEHRADAAGTYSITLSDNSKKTVKVEDIPQAISLAGGWDLRLQSWGPGEKAARLSKENNYDYSVDPTVSEKKDITFKNIDLVKWSDLPASKDQLTAIGVEGMNKVSGIGWYSTTFELSKEWSNIGAYMKFEHNSDMIVEVKINGNVINDIDQMNNITDVGKYLKKGKNTIEIKLDTTLQNRASTSGTTAYGLTKVSLVPYYKTPL